MPRTSSSHDAEATLHSLACEPRKGRRHSHSSQKVQQAAETGDMQGRDTVRSQGLVPWSAEPEKETSRSERGAPSPKRDDLKLRPRASVPNPLCSQTQRIFEELNST